MTRGVITDIVRADAESVLRVLLVEHDPIDRAVFVQLMRASHDAPEVVTAAGFSAAVDTLRLESIDTVFCSVAGQDMELFRALVRIARPRPVVALLAEGESAIQNHVAEAGAVRILWKEHLLSSFVQRMVEATRACPDRLPAYA
jgi:DNA-binding NarL/FixJ family response regulator